jgi:hypothetical protein
MISFFLAIFASLGFSAKVKFPQFLPCIPARNRANAFFAISENQEQDAQTVGCAQRLPPFFPALVTKVDDDGVVRHRLLEFRTGNSVTRQVL